MFSAYPAANNFMLGRPVATICLTLLLIALIGDCCKQTVAIEKLFPTRFAKQNRVRYPVSRTLQTCPGFQQRAVHGELTPSSLPEHSRFPTRCQVHRSLGPAKKIFRACLG
jgi:hypothetical protein